jgi:hypothetical protein
VELHGMLVTTGVRTAFDALRLAPWTDRALAWGDACIRFDLTTPTELARYAADRKRWPGIRRVTVANLGGLTLRAVDAAAELSTKWLSLRASGGHPHPNVRICSR